MILLQFTVEVLVSVDARLFRVHEPGNFNLEMAGESFHHSRLTDDDKAFYCTGDREANEKCKTLLEGHPASIDIRGHTKVGAVGLLIKSPEVCQLKYSDPTKRGELGAAHHRTWHSARYYAARDALVNIAKPIRAHCSGRQLISP